MSVVDGVGSIVTNIRDGIAGDSDSLSKRLVLGGSAVIVTWMAITPFLFLLWLSVWTGDPGQLNASFTLEYLIDIYTNPGIYQLYLNSFTVAFGGLVISLFLGVSFAWLFARTNLPTKAWMEFVLLTPYAVSSLMLVVMYVYSFGPTMGLYMNFFKNKTGWVPFDIFSIWGIILVTGIMLTPVVYLLVVPALRNMDPAFEEVSRVHGGGWLATIREVSLPVVLPAVSSAAIIAFVWGLASFAIVVVLGLDDGFHVIPTRIWAATSLEIPPQWNVAAAISTSFVLITVLLVWYHRRRTSRQEDFMTVTGKGFKPRQWDLGRWRWPIAGLLWALLIVLWIAPIIAVVVVSFHDLWLGQIQMDTMGLENYGQVFSLNVTQRAIGNSFILGLIGGIIGTLLITFFMFYVERTEGRFGWLGDYLTMITMAGGPIIIGMSVYFVYVWLGKFTPMNLPGTLWIEMIAMLTVFFPVISRMAQGGILQIHSDLIESARLFGASWLTTMREIFFPLYKGTLGAIFFFIFIHMVRHLDAVLMTYAHGTETLAIIIFQQWYIEYEVGLVAALVVSLFLIIGVMLAILRYFGFQFYEVA